MESYSERIGRFITGLQINDIPSAVRAKAKLVFLDTLGVILAGSERPVDDRSKTPGGGEVGEPGGVDAEQDLGQQPGEARTGQR